MSDKQASGGGRLGFLDPLARLFRAKGEAPAPQPAAASRFDALQSSFEAALQGLDQKIEASRRATVSTGSARFETKAEDRAAENLRRMQQSHQAIRADIEALHAELGTGLTSAALPELATYLEELHASATAGRDSHSLLPRSRSAIAERFRLEAGELAVTRLVALLKRAQRQWPDPTYHRPSATPEEIERSRRRRLGDVRAAFLAQDLETTAQRLLGEVRGWKSDYPDRGSPLWQECALEGVAAGLRSQLLKEFVERLSQDRDLIIARAEASIGKELEAIQKTLAEGVRSLEQAHLAVASSLRVLDEVVPEIAWQHIQSQLAHARGEFDA